MNIPENLRAVRPAATLVILRDVGRGPEVLMAERGQDMVFAGGALVFPGGAVDQADLDHADVLSLPHDREEVAARIAAIRETVEESGLAIGFSTQPEPAAVAALRAALAQGDAFFSALEEAGLRLDLDALVPFARWIPPENSTRRFDTRFYIAHLDDGAAEGEADGSETMRLLWETPATLIGMAERGEARIIFPTLRNLERIGQFSCVEDILTHSRSLSVERIAPWTEERGGIQHLCIPEGLGYPVTAVPLSKAQRG